MALPSAPTNVVAYPGNGQAYITFTGSNTNGGPAISSYTVTSSPGGFTATGAASGIIMTGLSNGTSYTFTVTGTNTVGTSPASAPSAAVTPDATIAVGQFRRTFAYTGAMQSWVVPTNTTSVAVDVVAAGGGSFAAYPDEAGFGGRVQATMTVTPGSTLNIFVGGKGTDYLSPAVPGWNGGGGPASGSSVNYATGGGATDIRIGGTALSHRVIVAGGGAGARNGLPYFGGHGGGVTGGDGQFTTTGNGELKRGLGGTQTAGGRRGCGFSGCGTAGTLGVGGDCGSSSAFGSAGGGGYYGGGGSADSATGGGGSSYADASRCSSVVHTQGYNRDQGYLLLTFTP